MYSPREFQEKSGYPRGCLINLEKIGIISPKRDDKNMRVYTEIELTKIREYVTQKRSVK